LAVQDHTDIDELTTVNSRHSSKDCVLERDCHGSHRSAASRRASR
jgi:hypothetical protein